VEIQDDFGSLAIEKPVAAVKNGDSVISGKGVE